MRRYFIGIELPADITEKVSVAQHQSVTSNHLMAPIVPHITLLHPGITNEVSPIYLLPKLKKLQQEHMPMSIKLSDYGWFDKRVLYIAVSSPELYRLHQKITELLPEKVRSSHMTGRSFTPHVTLAQAKQRQQLAGDIELSFQHKLAGVLPTEFEATRITQFIQTAPRTYKTKPVK